MEQSELDDEPCIRSAESLKHEDACISSTEIHRSGGSGRKGPIQLRVTKTSEEVAEQLLRGTFNAREVTKEAILKQKEETGVEQSLPPMTDRTASQDRNVSVSASQQREQHNPMVVPDLSLRGTSNSPYAKENLGSSANHSTQKSNET